MAISGLVYDRTIEDVTRWLLLTKKLDSSGWDSLTDEEQVEWTTRLKGAYNFSDLNRVGEAVAYLAQRYRALIPHLDEYRIARAVADDVLFHVPYKDSDVAVEPKTDWQLNDHVWADQAARYLLDLVTLRCLMAVPDGTPEVPPDMIGLTYQEANDIERLLDMLDDEITRKTNELEQWIRNTAAAWLFCVEPNCGEVQQ